MSARERRGNPQPTCTGWAMLLAVVAGCADRPSQTDASAGADTGLEAVSDRGALDGPGAPDIGADSEPAPDAVEDVAVDRAGAGDAAGAADLAADAPIDGPVVTGPAAVLLSPAPRLVPLGGPLVRTLELQFGRDLALAIDAAGKPFVAFAGGNPNDSRVHVLSWNEAQGRWEALPSLRVAAADKAFPTFPQLALDPMGRPIVVWEEIPKPYSAPFKIHAQRWSGSAWEMLPDVPDSTRPSLVVDGAGNISVLVTPPSSGGPMRVFRLREGGWQPEVDPGQLGSTIGFLAGNARGDLEVTWTRQVSGVQFVPERRRLVGGEWIVPQGSLVYGPASSGTMGLRALIGPDGLSRYDWAELVVHDGRVTVTPAVLLPGWTDRQLLTDLTDDSITQRLALDAVSTPVLAVGQRSMNQLHLRWWTGAAWKPLGMPILPTHPDQGELAVVAGLAFTPSGQLVIALIQQVAMNSEVFVFRLDP
jgi:hypothetical protein